MHKKITSDKRLCFTVAFNERKIQLNGLVVRLKKKKRKNKKSCIGFVLFLK